MDLAASLIKNDPDKSATIAIWKDLNGWFQQKYPPGVLIAEWFNPKQSIEVGFNIDFFKPGHLFASMKRGEKTPSKVYFDKSGEAEIVKWYNSNVSHQALAKELRLDLKSIQEDNWVFQMKR